jgi:hypothetical protein
VVRTSVEERMSVFEGKEGKGTQEEVAVPPVNPSLLAVVDHTVIRHHRQPLARRKALPHHATRALKLQARPRHSPSARPPRAQEVAIEAGTARLEHLRRQIGAEVVGSGQ